MPGPETMSDADHLLISLLKKKNNTAFQSLEQFLAMKSKTQQICNKFVMDKFESMKQQICRSSGNKDDYSNLQLLFQALQQFSSYGENPFGLTALITYGLANMMVELFQWLSRQVVKKTAPPGTILEDFFETLNAVADYSLKAKSLMVESFFHPILKFALDGSVKFAFRLEAIKSVNLLLEHCPTSSREKTKSSPENQTLLKELSSLILTIGDYEFQVGITECLFRLTHKGDRPALAKVWLAEPHHQLAFLGVRDSEFETDCRSFLNVINADLPENCRVFSIPCVSAVLGSYELHKPEDVTYTDFWVDFNSGSKRISIFCNPEPTESQVDEDESLWETCIVWDENVMEYSLSERNGIMKGIIYLNCSSRDLVNFGPSQYLTESKVHLLFNASHDVSLAFVSTFGSTKYMSKDEELAQSNKASQPEYPVEIHYVRENESKISDDVLSKQQEYEGLDEASQVSAVPSSQVSQDEQCRTPKVSIPCWPMQMIKKNESKQQQHARTNQVVESISHKAAAPEFKAPKTPDANGKKPKKVKTPLTMVSTSPSPRTKNNVANDEVINSKPNKTINIAVTKEPKQSQKATDKRVNSSPSDTSNSKSDIILNSSEDKSHFRHDQDIHEDVIDVDDLKPELLSRERQEYIKQRERAAASPALSTVTEESSQRSTRLTGSIKSIPESQPLDQDMTVTSSADLETAKENSRITRSRKNQNKTKTKPQPKTKRQKKSCEVLVDADVDNIPEIQKLNSHILSPQERNKIIGDTQKLHVELDSMDIEYVAPLDKKKCNNTKSNQIQQAASTETALNITKTMEKQQGKGLSEMSSSVYSKARGQASSEIVLNNSETLAKPQKKSARSEKPNKKLPNYNEEELSDGQNEKVSHNKNNHSKLTPKNPFGFDCSQESPQVDRLEKRGSTEKEFPLNFSTGSSKQLDKRPKFHKLLGSNSSPALFVSSQETILQQSTQKEPKFFKSRSKERQKEATSESIHVYEFQSDVEHETKSSKQSNKLEKSSNKKADTRNSNKEVYNKKKPQTLSKSITSNVTDVGKSRAKSGKQNNKTVTSHTAMKVGQETKFSNRDTHKPITSSIEEYKFTDEDNGSNFSEDYLRKELENSSRKNTPKGPTVSDKTFYRKPGKDVSVQKPRSNHVSPHDGVLQQENDNKAPHRKHSDETRERKKAEEINDRESDQESSISELSEFAKLCKGIADRSASLSKSLRKNTPVNYKDVSESDFDEDELAETKSERKRRADILKNNNYNETFSFAKQPKKVPESKKKKSVFSENDDSSMMNSRRSDVSWLDSGRKTVNNTTKTYRTKMKSMPVRPKLTKQTIDPDDTEQENTAPKKPPKRQRKPKQKKRKAEATPEVSTEDDEDQLGALYYESTRTPLTNRTNLMEDIYSSINRATEKTPRGSTKKKTPLWNTGSRYFKPLEILKTPIHVTPGSEHNQTDDESVHSVERFRLEGPCERTPCLGDASQMSNASACLTLDLTGPLEDDLQTDIAISSTHVSGLKTPISQKIGNKSDSEEEDESIDDEEDEEDDELVKSGPSSRSLKSREALKRKYQQLEESKQEELLASMAVRSPLRPRRLFHQKPQAVIESDELDYYEETSRLNQYNPISRLDTHTQANRLDEHSRNKRLIEYNQTSRLDQYNQAASVSSESTTNTIGTEEIGLQTGVATLVKSFGTDIQKNMMARKHHLEQLTKGTLRNSQKQVCAIWNRRKSTRDNTFEDFHSNLMAELIELEKDMDNLKDAEEKAMNFFRQQHSIVQACASSQQKRLKNIEDLHTTFNSDVNQNEQAEVGEQESIRKVLRKELMELQKKLLQESQQQEMANMKKSLQAMFL